MRKYKVNRKEEIKLPTKEEVEKFKDFPRLRHEFDRYVQRPTKPIYKDKKLFFFILIIVLMAFILAQVANEKDKDADQDNQIDTTEVNQNTTDSGGD